MNSIGSESYVTVSFPSEFKTPQEKDTDEYGLKYAKAIWDTYYNTGGFTTKRRKAQELKRWAEGRQSVADMKKLWGLEPGDTSYVNLDWTAPCEVARFVDVLLGLFLNQQFKPICKAVDNISLTKKDEEYRKIKAAFVLKDTDKVLAENGLPKITPPNIKQFDTMEEIDLYFDLNFKQAVEIALELGIEVVLSNNEYEELKKDVLKNLIIQKTGGIRVFYSNNNTIKLKSLDPEFLILPYSQKPDHKDTNYWGYIDYMTVGEIKQQAGNTFTEDEYRNIAKQAANQWTNPVWGVEYDNPASYRYLNFLIPVMEFEFLSLNTEQRVFITNSFGNKRSFVKDANYNIEKGKEKGDEVEEDTVQQKYSGNYIVGTDYVYNYGLSKNMIYKRMNNTYADETPLSAIIYTPDIYENTNKSFVERMLPHAKQCHLALLKMQEIQALAVVKGIEIDISGLSGIKLGKGKEDADPMELIELFKQKGTFLTRRINDDGTTKNGKVIQELENGMSQDLERYMASYNFHQNKMREMVSVNSAVDASTVGSETAVGVQKMQINATINALRPLKSAFVNIMQRSCNNIALMIQDLLRHNKGSKDIFINSLGNRTTEVLEAVKDIPLRDYAISIEYEQNEEDRQAFLETLNLSLKQQLIKPSDVYALKVITNTKVAYNYLKERERKYAEEKAADADARSKAQSEGSAQAAQAAEQARMQTEMELKKATSELEQVKADLLQEQTKLAASLEMIRMKEEYRLKNELAIVTESAKSKTESNVTA